MIGAPAPEIPLGRALSFNGAGNYVATPNLRNYFSNETITVEAWFNAAQPGVILNIKSVHILAVITEVPARLPQACLGDVRGEYNVIARFLVLLVPEVFHRLADAPALGVPEDEAGTDLVVQREQLQLAADEGCHRRR